MADQMQSPGDLVTSLDLATQSNSSNFAALIAALQSIFPQVSSITGGTFTCAAATSTTVAQPLTKANSFILLMPTNASAAALMAGVNSLYFSARTADTSFTVTGAGAAAGTETFAYLLVNL